MEMSEKVVSFVYIVSYCKDGEPITIAFNNKEAAQELYEYIMGVFETWYAHNDGLNPDDYRLQINICPVYSNFSTFFKES